MKHRKIRKGVFKYTPERLSIDIRAIVKPRTLDCIQDYPEAFHPFYVHLLLESGLTLEESLELLAEGALHPN